MRWDVRRTGRLLVGLGVAAVVGCVVLVVWTHLGQRADERSRWAVGVPWRTARILSEWLGLVSVEFIAVVLALAVLVALVRRRVSRALAALLVVAGANVTTQLLKALLPRPDHGIGAENTLPSGHVTVVTSLVLATLLVVPPAWRRPVTLLASGAGTLTGAAVIIQRWHRPSDVVAAYGVCAVFVGLALLLDSRTRGLDGAATGPLPVTGRCCPARTGRGRPSSRTTTARGSRVPTSCRSCAPAVCWVCSPVTRRNRAGWVRRDWSATTAAVPPRCST